MYVNNSFICVENNDWSKLRYPTDVKSTVFQSQLEVSHVSSHTEVL